MIRVSYFRIGDAVFSHRYQMIGYSPSGKEVWFKIPGPPERVTDPEITSMFERRPANGERQHEAEAPKDTRESPRDIP